MKIHLPQSQAKKVMVISAVFSVMAACQQGIPAGSYQLQGEIAGMKGDKVFIQTRTDSGLTFTDSALLEQEHFTFRGSVDEPHSITLFFRNSSGVMEPLYSSFYLENADIQLKGDIRNRRDISISGAREEAIRKKIAAATAYPPRYGHLRNQFYQAEIAGKELPKDSVSGWRAEIVALESQHTRQIKTAVNEHMGSYVALHTILDNAGIFTGEELKKMSAQFSQLQKSPSYQKLLSTLEVTSTAAVGQPLTRFTLPDSFGQSHTLSTMKGQWLLVEFWASWCGPCRKSIPALKAAVAQHNELSIVGVSIDEDTLKWKQALHQEQMPWINLVAPSADWAWKNYLITAIPANFLLDSKRNIVAKNISPSEIVHIIETTSNSHQHHEPHH